MKSDWQKHVLASSGYVELGMLDDAALVLAKEDRSRSTRPAGRSLVRVLTSTWRPKKWEMAAGVASHLVKTEPETSGWSINLAYAKRRCEGIESAEAILLRARELHHDNAMIEFNLACYASVAGRFEEAKERLKRAVELDKQFQKVAIDDEDLRPLWDWIADLA